MPGLPILFGTAKNQEMLLRLHREGTTRFYEANGWQSLRGSGLVVAYRNGSEHWLALEQRHHAYSALRNVLNDLADKHHDKRPRISKVPPQHLNTSDRPLAHPVAARFRVLERIATAAEPLDIETLVRRLPDLWRETTKRTVAALETNGVLTTRRDGTITFAANVPRSFVRLVRALGAKLAETDTRYGPPSDFEGRRPAAFNSEADGAPRLFGTDARLRNLMALAVHGPLMYAELRRITGAGHMALEDRSDAPFGRGDVVRVWDTKNGPAVMLDEAHPLALPLLRLLIALERTYRLNPYKARLPSPKPPRRRRWVGDTDALFGGPIPTGILMTIGALGWTFEALCCACIEHDRWNVKKSMRRLEEEGVLEGDRPRKPGMNVRIVRIADGFVARDELIALLRAAVEAWPSYRRRVRTEIQQLHHKTKVILDKRGLM
ncbi:MAG TPA: hypothetical protein VGU66_09055 [Candidatus Elarobacter sp.]|nr:hypothetical protein [Candidatus Elarobacter sp.]